MADMTAAMAREIISQATKYGAFEIPDIPNGQDPAGMEIEEIKSFIKLNDEEAKKSAAELVTLARGAYDKNIRTDAIFEILFAALVEPTSDELAKYEEVFARHPDHGRTAHDPAPGSEPSGLDKSEADVADGKEEQASVDINAIVPGYDDRKVAELKSVIIAAAEAGDLSEEEWEQIKAYEISTEERKSILSLEPKFKPKTIAEGIERSGAGTNLQPGDYGSRDGLEGAYSDGSIGMDRVGQEGLPVPPQYTGDEPLLPVDITSISDQELSRLTMRFHSLEARTIWLASQEAGRRDVAEHLSKEAWADAFGHHFSRLKSAITKETAAAIDAVRGEAKHEADVADAVRTWRTRAVRHAAEARSMDAISEGYEKAATRLSREQSRREKLAQTPS